MPYDDDDDLFNHEFDFVDDDDDEVKDKAKDDEPKPRRRGNGRGRSQEKSEGGEKSDKPASRGPKRGGPARPRRNGGRGAAEQKPAAPAPPLEPAPVGYLMDDVPDDDIPEEPSETEAEVAAVPAGPPADHVVHIYEYGAYKRTVNRKFTDEEAVSFAEEFTRTGKAYGRYAIATPEDEEPAPTFAGAARG